MDEERPDLLRIERGSWTEIEESAARGLVSKHAGAVFKERSEQLEELLILRLAGARVRLTEDHSKPGKVVWSYEVDHG